MSVQLTLLTALLVGICAPVALAQETGSPPQRPRTDDERLLKGQPPVPSFADLVVIVEPGDEVVVRQSSGRHERGRVALISDNQIVLSGKRSGLFLRHSQPRTFPADSVTRIDIVDSPWNGALIGAAIAPALVFGIHRWEEQRVPDSNDMKGLLTIVVGGVSAVASVAIGLRIDLSMNRSIYERRSLERHLTMAPWIDRNRRGVAAQLHF